jgi:uncharacterized membrane protein
MFQWLRRRFLAGFFVSVPLVVSVAAFVWIFTLIDGFVGPFYASWLGREVPGLGIVTTALVVLVIGVFATNVIGKQLLQRAERYLLLVPVFRTIYSPVKQLVAAFSPDNEYGFKRVAMIEDEARGFMLGFLTKEFTVDRGTGPATWWRSTCRRIICIWATSSSARARRCRIPTSPWNRGSGSS